MNQETIFSVDIESDGPVPGLHSMLSIGVVAYSQDGKEIDAFEANLGLLPGATQHPQTMQWWATQGTAYADSRVGAEDPAQVIPDLARWVGKFPGMPVFLGYPATFDWMFVAYYMHRFNGGNPFGYCGLDMESFAAGALGLTYEQATRAESLMPWKPALPHTHRALDDAREQGRWFFNLRDGHVGFLRSAG